MRPLSWGRRLFRDSDTGLQSNMPHMDVIDRDEDLLIRAELPGVNKNDIDISIASDNTLTIKGSCHSEEKEEKGDFLRHEVSSGTFTRTMMLPCEVNSEEASTSFKDGLLEMTLPKLEKTKRKTIRVA